MAAGCDRRAITLNSHEAGADCKDAPTKNPKAGEPQHLACSKAGMSCCCSEREGTERLSRASLAACDHTPRGQRREKAKRFRAGERSAFLPTRGSRDGRMLAQSVVR